MVDQTGFVERIAMLECNASGIWQNEAIWLQVVFLLKFAAELTTQPEGLNGLAEELMEAGFVP